MNNDDTKPLDDTTTIRQIPSTSQQQEPVSQTKGERNWLENFISQIGDQLQDISYIEILTTSTKDPARVLRKAGKQDILNELENQGFFQHLLILPGYNIDSDVDFWTLWNKSILQLNPDSRKRFAHHIKLDFERKAEDECHGFKSFENLRFETRDNPESVVVEGRCTVCGLYRPAAFNLYKYMYMANKTYPNGVITITCPNCKKDGSLVFPVLF